MDQSQNASSPENAGGQPPSEASAPFAGDFPAPVGPPVQPALAPPTAPRPVSALPHRARRPATASRRRTAASYPSPTASRHPAVASSPPRCPARRRCRAKPFRCRSRRRPWAPAGLTPTQGMPDMSKAPRPMRGTEADTDLTGWDLNGLLIQVLERKCSDLHMTIGAPPTIRLNGSAGARRGLPGAHRRSAAEGALRDHHPEAAGALRGGARARLRVLGPRARRGSASTSTASATRSAPRSG